MQLQAICPKCGTTNTLPIEITGGGLALLEDMRMSCDRCGGDISFANADINPQRAEAVRLTHKPGDARTWAQKLGTLGDAVKSAQAARETPEEFERKLSSPELVWAKPLWERIVVVCGPKGLKDPITVLAALLTIMLTVRGLLNRSPDPSIVEVPEEAIDQAIRTTYNVTVNSNVTINNNAPPAEAMGVADASNKRVGADRPRGPQFKKRPKHRPR